MKSSRLTTAIDDGLLTVPERGRIAVFRARVSDDLSALPMDRVEVIQGFKPDHDAFKALGYTAKIAPEGEYALSIVFIPRARSEARALIAQAAEMTPGGGVVVDGQKNDGIDSLLKDCRKRVEIDGHFAKSHGKIFTFRSTTEFADWRFDGEPVEIAPGYCTVPGVFSADAIDRGSLALVQALPQKLPARVADLGAGWGFLAGEILKRDGVKELHLFEAEHDALTCARLNIRDERAEFHWADVPALNPSVKFNAIITNPPFHTTRAADPALGRAFLAAAARMLLPNGQLWVVANRHLPYEKTLEGLFRSHTEAGGNSGFKVLHASHPLPKPRGR